MNEAELQAFLDRPLTATVSTVSLQGRPHSIPVWFVHHEGRSKLPVAQRGTVSEKDLKGSCSNLWLS
jgi:nitroimidazol reductase NimA-like FMN-containing flavoprotein (pyridoxamine 5'-phosphate oxidase superfamily)